MQHLVVRKEHTLCTRCGGIEPVYPGDGTPAITFVVALELMADRHWCCSFESRKRKEKKP